MVYENIVALCKEHGISIARLEKECGLGNATVRGWKNGSPTLKCLVEVAHYFGVSLDELVLGKERRK